VVANTGTARRFIEPNDLTGLLRAHVPGRLLIQLERLTGGSKKGVYRLSFAHGGTLVLYAWHLAESYWPIGSDLADDPFADASGPAEFAVAHAALTAAGVRVPRLHVLDHSREHHPADVALVEDVRGGSLADLLERDDAAAARPLTCLGRPLRAMHGCGGAARYGKVSLEAAGAAPSTALEAAQPRPEDMVLNRALRHLDAAAAQLPDLETARPAVADLLAARHDAVTPRAQYGLVHGELGPDHVLLDDQLAPVIIDIEGLTYFDAEWEHAFLRLRFGPAGYRRLGLPAVDETRVALYDVAQRLSLIAGPLRIAATDFPDRDWMLQLADYHTAHVLTLARLERTGNRVKLVAGC
jgi:hypothetical protein